MDVANKKKAEAMIYRCASTEDVQIVTQLRLSTHYSRLFLYWTINKRFIRIYKGHSLRKKGHTVSVTYVREDDDHSWHVSVISSMFGNNIFIIDKRNNAHSSIISLIDLLLTRRIQNRWKLTKKKSFFITRLKLM